MRVLIACEFSGAIRDAFRRLGHEAWSCDNAEEPEGEFPWFHYDYDVRHVIANAPWDLMIAHPPCTYLSASGARWWKDRQPEQTAALDFVRELMAAPIPRIAIENPIGRISSTIRKPDQIIHPWQFGVRDHKATCLWLKGLPKLVPTRVVFTSETKIHRMSPSPERSKNRSRTEPAVAAAIAAQWGGPEQTARA